MKIAEQKLQHRNKGNLQIWNFKNGETWGGVLPRGTTLEEFENKESEPLSIVFLGTNNYDKI